MQIRQIVRSAVLQTSEAARGWLNGGSLCPGSDQLCYAAGTGAAGLCQGMTFKELQLCIMFLSNFLIIWISLTEAISDLRHMLCE